MTIRTTLFVAALALAGCKKKENDKPATPPTPAATTTPKPTEPPKPEPVKATPLVGDALAKKYLDCVGMVNDAKYDAFKKDCVSTDFKGHEMDAAEMPNPDAVIAFFQSMRAGFPDYKLQPQLVIVNGRNIIGVMLMTGTHSADWKMPDGKELKKTDKKIGQLFLHRLAINDENKATEEWAYSDAMSMMGQLGQLPKEAAGQWRPALDKGWPGAPIIVVAADDAKEKANVEGVNKGMAAMNAHKAADITAMMTDDSLESDQAAPVDHKGKKEIEKSTQMFLTAFPDAKIEATNVYGAGDYVVLQGTFAGTNKGAMGPMKATNKEVKGNFAEVFKIKDGKVAELWRFRNGMAMAMQMGMMGEPKKDEPKKDEPKKDAPKPEPKK